MTAIPGATVTPQNNGDARSAAKVRARNMATMYGGAGGNPPPERRERLED